MTLDVNVFEKPKVAKILRVIFRLLHFCSSEEPLFYFLIGENQDFPKKVFYIDRWVITHPKIKGSFTL